MAWQCTASARSILFSVLAVSAWPPVWVACLIQVPEMPSTRGWYRHSWAFGGTSSQTQTHSWGVEFITWGTSLGECCRGSRHFWNCRAHVCFYFAPGAPLKRPCVILVRLVGRSTNTQTAGLRLGREVGSVLLPAVNCAKCMGLWPHHQPKQMTWTPTNHSRGPSTANKPITAALSIKQHFSELTFESLLWINLVSSLHLCVDTKRRRLRIQHLQICSSLTQSPFLYNQAITPASPSPRVTILLILTPAPWDYIDTLLG